MTNESRRAFEGWFREKHGSTAYCESRREAWQASEARILAILDSEEMVEDIARAIIIARDGKRDGERRYQNSTIKKAYQGDAKAALQAIKQKIGE